MMRWNEIMEGVGGWTPEAYANRKSPFGSRDVIEEPGFLYHGTAKVRLPAIRREGLMPATKARFARDPMIGEWSIGKVFFTTNADSAKFYATEASKTAPLLLRVPESAVADAMEDHKDNNAVYVEKAVPASVIEYWSGKAWKPVSQPLKESIENTGDPATELHELVQEVKAETGSTMEAEMMDDQIHLTFIERGTQRGSGSRALQMLIEFADERHLGVILTVLHNSPKLVRFYQKLGFVVEGFPSDDAFERWFADFEKDWTIDNDDEEIVMVRSPK